LISLASDIQLQDDEGDHQWTGISRGEPLKRSRPVRAVASFMKKWY